MCYIRKNTTRFKLRRKPGAGNSDGYTCPFFQRGFTVSRQPVHGFIAVSHMNFYFVSNFRIWFVLPAISQRRAAGYLRNFVVHVVKGT